MRTIKLEIDVRDEHAAGVVRRALTAHARTEIASLIGSLEIDADVSIRESIPASEYKGTAENQYFSRYVKGTPAEWSGERQ